MADIILISGMPGCGKTTFLKEVIRGSGLLFDGFFTDEVRKRNERIGFDINFLDGESTILARKGFISDFKVGKYGINLRGFEEMLEKKMNIFANKFVVIDEIGKMELLSNKFKEIIEYLLNSCRLLLASILYHPYPYADIIKQRTNVQMFELNSNNYMSLRNKIENILTTYIQD